MGAFKDVYDIIKDLLKLAKECGNQQMTELAIDLQGRFFQLKEENEKFREENKNLQNKVKEDFEEKKIKKSLIPQTSAFYIRKNDKVERYYCGRCWDKDKKLIQLMTYPNWTENKFKELNCPECKMRLFAYKNYINKG